MNKRKLVTDRGNEVTFTKIVINRCYGGFSVSEAAIQRYSELKGKELLFDYMDNNERFKSYYYMEDGRKNYVNPYNLTNRTDPVLIQVIEELGSEKASGYGADLFIDELEAGTLYRIAEYDGQEWIETKDDIEWSVA